MPLTDLELLHGRDEPPIERFEVRAGPLVATLDGIELRWVRVGGVEVLRGIYPAIRDEAWGTLPAEVVSIEHEVGDACFLVRFEARSRQGAIDIAWGGSIEGSADGTIVYGFRGQAESTFRYCRIGLNVLHPPAAAGQPFHGDSPAGPVSGRLPLHVEPPPFVDGVSYGLFPAVSGLTIEVADGVEALTVFEGDLFEMEDQRNWTDASFKTYSTPLALGVPLEATSGRTFSQVVRLSATAAPPRTAGTSRVSVELGEPLERGLPELGLGLPDDLAPPTERERGLLRALGLDHVRADLHPGESGWRERLEAASACSRALDAGLELALHLPAQAQVSLEALAGAPLARVLVLAQGLGTTPGELVVAVRDELRRLGVGCPVGGGTDMFFADLNMDRPDADAMEVVCYPVTPQVHAFDDASIMETPSIQGLTVETARGWSGGRPIAVGPVTLRMRYNPYEEKPRPTPPGALPESVDHRQPSLLCAAWTVASLASLAYAGADSVTYFETVGWRGVLEREQGSPLPKLFPSEPGMVFPVYYALAALAGRRAGRLVAVAVPAEDAVGVLALQTQTGLRALVANLAPRARELELARFPSPLARVRVLDIAAARALMRAPEQFSSLGAEARVSRGRLRIVLPTYALAIVDAVGGPGSQSRQV